MIHDAEVRVPLSKELKDSFARACDLANGKRMATVARDLIDCYNKAMRKGQTWPANFEPPNHKDVVQAAIRLLSGEFKESLN